MPSQELHTIVDMLRSNPITGETIEEMRAGMEATAQATPVPDGVRFTPVDAGGVPAEWHDAEGARDSHVVVYFHGGGYCIGSIDSHRGLTARISKLANLRVLSVDYRLAPEHPHPAAVEDGLRAYRFVLDQGIPANRIALAGDSAGGGLVLATLLSIRDQGLPTPACGVGISAWTDMTASGDSIKTKASIDPVISNMDGIELMIESFVGKYGDRKDPLVSPLFGDFKGIPPLLLQVGTAEVLLDDTTRVAEVAQKAGVDVSLRVWEDMIHVWHAFAEMVPEAAEAVDELVAFLNEKLD